MAVQVKMPQLGLTMTAGTVARWLKAEGDPVTKGEVMFEVETDKITSEVESGTDGILRRIIAKKGDEVPVQGVVAIIGTADEEIVIDGEGEPQMPVQAGKSGEHPASLNEIEPQAAQGDRLKASPFAKKLAAAKGVDLSSVRGSGPNGRIVRRDVDNAQIVPDARQASALPHMHDMHAAVIPVYSTGIRREKMNSMRRSINQNMKLSWDTAPAVHYNRSADVSALNEWKNSLSQNGRRISYTDILTKITAAALMEYPNLNCSVDGDDIIYHDYVNMGIAVALEDGLVVPVIKNAEVKGIGAISKEIRDFSARAKEGKLTSDEMSGGTFTITNLGMFGMESFTPIINQPESAILGVNAIVKMPVDMEGEIVTRPKLTLSLTADHRVIDGAVAAKFLQRLCILIENPWQMLL